ncbi:SseB family protein [Mycobacteroides sp. LB1]|uniref:SseB family protein n=1 Tax=Mycobacteroides sp. LB1 TaxID=2750814 RepID=UPI0015DE7874|nr:SseB family protein [Mycobacteroides sp. LB1]
MDLVDNANLRRAVTAFAAEPGQQRVYDVLRACMYGEVLFDITGSDPLVQGSIPFPAGARLQIRGGTGPDGGRALFVYTCNEEIARHHPPGANYQSLVQSAASALELARSQGDRWLYIDPAGPTCALSAEEIDFAVRNPRNDSIREAVELVALGQADRQSVLDLLRQESPILLGADDRTVPGTVATRRTQLADGSVALVAFTSAPEVIGYVPSDAVVAVTTQKVLEVVIRDGYAGLVINPAGPSVFVPSAEIASI